MPKGTGLSKKDCANIYQKLEKLLAENFVLYIKTLNFHWNVTGPHFQQLHAMFQLQYEDLALAIDEIAERIRAVGHFAPGNMAKFIKTSSLKEQSNVQKAMDMVSELAEDHEKLCITLRDCVKCAQKVGDESTMDMCIKRLQLHEKTAWMLRATLG